MPNNPFVTKIYDIVAPTTFTEMNYLFIVQEYIHTDLKKVFESIPQLYFDEEHMILIIYNILCAVNFIHTAGIIHRDIKPANFLMDLNCKIKICDFGLARSLPVQ